MIPKHILHNKPLCKAYSDRIELLLSEIRYIDPTRTRSKLLSEAQKYAHKRNLSVLAVVEMIYTAVKFGGKLPWE